MRGDRAIDLEAGVPAAAEAAPVREAQSRGLAVERDALDHAIAVDRVLVGDVEGPARLAATTRERRGVAERRQRERPRERAGVAARRELACKGGARQREREPQQQG